MMPEKHGNLQNLHPVCRLRIIDSGLYNFSTNSGVFSYAPFAFRDCCPSSTLGSKSANKKPEYRHVAESQT